MTQLTWSDEFSVGVEEIDEQHKMLFELLNRLFLAAVRREDQQLTIEILDALVDYTKVHFALEERLLEESGYPALPGHRRDHQHFIEKINNIAKKFQHEDHAVTIELMSFLKNWLQNHIRRSDMAYAAHLARVNFRTETWESAARAKRHEASIQTKPWWKFWSDASMGN